MDSLRVVPCLNSLICLAVLSFSAGLVVSCTEEVDLYGDGQPVPIVYCILDPADSLQYVRIGRSFQAGGHSLDDSPVSDSTVWDIPHEVYIEEYAGGVKGRTYFFEPDYNIRKDTGFFPATNLRLYSSILKPVPGNSYQLYVYFPDIEKMVSAKITVHGLPEIVDPLPISIRKINFEPGQQCVIRWYPGLNTGAYEMIFRIHYRDSFALVEEFNTADYSSKTIFNQQTGQMQEYGMGGPAFFAAMAAEIPVIPGNVREVISVEFIMISCGIDLGFHYRAGVETGTNFTNLTGYSNLRNGMGIFSSRYESRIPNLALSEVTLDLLARNEVTRSLGFKDSKGNKHETTRFFNADCDFNDRILQSGSVADR
ncbi:MAG: hypothetical protein V2A67_02345 [Bacteroidota bacterium]